MRANAIVTVPFAQQVYPRVDEAFGVSGMIMEKLFPLPVEGGDSDMLFMLIGGDGSPLLARSHGTPDTQEWAASIVANTPWTADAPFNVYGMWLMGLDDVLAPTWQRTYDTWSPDTVTSISVEAGGDIAFLGDTSATVTPDPLDELATHMWLGRVGEGGEPVHSCPPVLDAAGSDIGSVWLGAPSALTLASDDLPQGKVQLATTVITEPPRPWEVTWTTLEPQVSTLYGAP